MSDLASEMHVIVLGCSGAFPTLSNPCAGYLIEVNGFKILLDLGYAAFPQLLRHTTAEAVDAVVITHGHPDHCVDVNPLLRARALGSQSSPALPIYCPPNALRAVLALDRPGMLDHAYDLREFEPGEQLHIGPFDVGTFLLPHWLPNAGLRLTAQGQTIAYTGDTGPSMALVDLAQDVDLLIAEATFPETVPSDSELYLSSARQVGQYAAAANTGAVILTHLSPGEDAAAAIDAARRSYDGPISIAQPASGQA